MFKKLWKDESGQGMVEYALILALIVVVVIGVMTALGPVISGKYTDVGKALDPSNEAFNPVE